MKNVLYISLILSLASCGFLKQEPININLNESNSKYVVEADLVDTLGDFTVNLTKTTNYFEEEDIPKVSGATVMLTNDAGSTTTLIESEPGKYVASGYNAVPNQTFDLKINLEDGSTIESSSLMPKSISIVDVIFDLEEASAFGKEGYVPYTIFFDDPDATNFYRLIITVNDERKDSFEELFLFDDVLTVKNEPIIVPIFFERLKSGDIVTMELLSMDEKTFNYLNTISSIIGGSDSAAPANPENNLSGDALGNFSCYSMSKITKIVP